MKQALVSAFDYDITDCLQETASPLVEIFDCYHCAPSGQKSYIKTEVDQLIHFTLFNPSLEKLVFAALDNCIFQPHHSSRCDFLIGNFQKLYFVEIKQVKARQRQEARSDAIRQLHSSISFFRETINLTNTNVTAVVCLKAKQVYPVQNAKRIADIVAFKENYNADLKEGQSDVF